MVDSWQGCNPEVSLLSAGGPEMIASESRHGPLQSPAASLGPHCHITRNIEPE